MTELAMPMSRPAPGKTASIALAVAVHLVLAVFLIYGIRWQTHAPTTVAVELVSSLPEPVAAPSPPPEPTPVPKQVEPKPEPPPPPRKPDIAVKEKPKPPPKPVPPKALPKVVPPQEKAPKYDRTAELLKQETEQLQQKRASDAAATELAKLRADQASAALSRAQAAWSEKIAAKIKGKIFRPNGASGNPVAIYEITLLPDGSLVGEPKRKKTTGNPALDAAIERAIIASSPLPLPDNPAAFQRVLVLTFRPLED